MSTNDKSEGKYEAFGARLKFLREQWQQTLRDVCNTLEIDEKTLRDYEAGKQLPTPEILDMFISHFLLTEDQAQDLRELAEDQIQDMDPTGAGLEDMLSKQLVMFMPIDSRVIYSDSMQATVNEHGVVLQFMQQNGNGQAIPVSKIGMSRQHAERVIKVLQDTLNHYNQAQNDQGKGNQKMLPSSDNKQQ